MFVALAKASGPKAVATIRGEGWVQQQLLSGGVRFEVFNCKGSLNVSYLLHLIGLVRAHRIDLIHAHLLGSSVYCAIAGALTGTPVIATFHGSVDISHTERLAWAKFAVLRRFARLVAVSPGLRTELAARLRVPPDEVRLIPNAVDLERFTGARASSLRGDLGLGPGGILLGSLGNIRSAKDYPTGVRMLRNLVDAGLDVHWAIAGEGRPDSPLVRELRALISELGLQGRVHLLGFVADPEHFLAALDVYLLCSSSEGLPLALIQAMAAGRTIVSTLCGVETVIRDGEIGWLAPVGDPAGLAASVTAALRARDEALRRAQKAQSVAWQQYGQNAMLTAYQALYEEVRGSRRTQRR